MARRFFGSRPRRTRRGNAPPKPIEVKVGKLNFSGLTQAYDWATIDQVFGLKLAFGWYDENVPILLAMNPLDAIGMKTYDRATKARKLGEGTVIVDEQKQAFTTALHLFEKLFTPKQSALPLVDLALAPDAKPSKSLAWQQTLLEAFKVFETYGMYYRPTITAERLLVPVPDEASPTPMFYYHIPVTELAQMRGSVLSVLLKEAVEVAKQTSISYEGDVPQLDGNAFLATLPKVLEAVAATAGGKSAVAPKMPKIRAVAPNGTSVRRMKSKFANTQVVHVLQVVKNPFHGSRGTRFDLIRDGMTVAEYWQAMTDSGCKNVNLHILEEAINRGFVEVV